MVVGGDAVFKEDAERYRYGPFDDFGRFIRLALWLQTFQTGAPIFRWPTSALRFEDIFRR